MAYAYKITQDGVQIDTSVCPPRIVSRIFPNFSGEPCTVSSDGYEVIFKDKQAWVQIGAWEVSETEVPDIG